MAMYEAILKEFHKQGLSQQQQLDQAELKKALDSISAKNTGIAEFDNEVAHQIWNQTVDTLIGGPVRLRDYINTMLKAQSILKDQVEKIQDQIKGQTDERRRQQLLNDLFSYSKDHRTLTIPFRLQQIKQTKQIEESRMQNSIKTSKSILFSMNVDQREESTDLSVVFVLNTVLLAIELIVMFQKHHFFTLLGICWVFCAYFLNYFQKKYVRFLLVWIGLSVIFDLVWMIIKANSFWYQSENNIYSNLQTGLLKFIVIMVPVQMIIKLVLIGLLLKYRSIAQNIRKKVDFCGLIFLLDGHHNIYNLFVQIQTRQDQNRESVNPFQGL